MKIKTADERDAYFLDKVIKYNIVWLHHLYYVN